MTSRFSFLLLSNKYLTLYRDLCKFLSIYFQYVRAWTYTSVIFSSKVKSSWFCWDHPSISRKLREPLHNYSPEDSHVHNDSIIDAQPQTWCTMTLLILSFPQIYWLILLRYWLNHHVLIRDFEHIRGMWAELGSSLGAEAHAKSRRCLVIQIPTQRKTAPQVVQVIQKSMHSGFILLVNNPSQDWSEFIRHNISFSTLSSYWQNIICNHGTQINKWLYW